MIYKNLCNLVLWTEVALALNGLSINGLIGTYSVLVGDGPLNVMQSRVKKGAHIDKTHA